MSRTSLFVAVMVVASWSLVPPAAVASGNTTERLSTLDGAVEGEHRSFGLTVDLGANVIVPDAGLLGTWRMNRFARLTAGYGRNVISNAHGLRGGLTATLPLFGPLSASFTGEGGFYLPARYPLIARAMEIDEEALGQVSYRYLNGLLGLELGKRSFTFFVRAGLTAVRVACTTADAQSTGSSAARLGDFRISMRGPAAKIGFAIYFF
jgi:hypothetical protein